MARIKKIIRRRRVKAPEECFFCQSNTLPYYKEPTALSKFLTERGKLFPRSRSGLCSRHQRQLTKAVKRARYISLLPYVMRPL